MSTVTEVLAATALVAILGALIVAATAVIRSERSGGPGPSSSVVAMREPADAPPTPGDELGDPSQPHGSPMPAPLPWPQDIAERYEAEVALPFEADATQDRSEPVFRFTHIPDGIPDARIRADDAPPPPLLLDPTDLAGDTEGEPGGRVEGWPLDGDDDEPPAAIPFVFTPSPRTSAPLDEAVPKTADRPAGFRASLRDSVDPITGVSPEPGDSAGVCPKCGAVYSERSVDAIRRRGARCVVCAVKWDQLTPNLGMVGSDGQLAPDGDQDPQVLQSGPRPQETVGNRPARASPPQRRARYRPGYRPGDLVEHNFHGFGEVAKVVWREGVDAIIWVEFDGDPGEVPIGESYQGMRRRS